MHVRRHDNRISRNIFFGPITIVVTDQRFTCSQGFNRVSMGFYSKWDLSAKTENIPRSNIKWSLKLLLRRLIVLMGTSKPENMSF